MLNEALRAAVAELAYAAAWKVAEHKLVGVRDPSAKSRAFPRREGFYILPKICLLPSNTTDANPPPLDWLR